MAEMNFQRPVSCCASSIRFTELQSWQQGPGCTAAMAAINCFWWFKDDDSKSWCIYLWQSNHSISNTDCSYYTNTTTHTKSTSSSTTADTLVFPSQVNRPRSCSIKLYFSLNSQFSWTIIKLYWGGGRNLRDGCVRIWANKIICMATYRCRKVRKYVCHDDIFS